MWTVQLRAAEANAPSLRVGCRALAAAGRELFNETFATHPMVNVARDPGEPAPRPRAAGVAYVIAEIALLPDFAPTSPGTEFPDVTDDGSLRPQGWRH